jgi:hypothetical protein
VATFTGNSVDTVGINASVTVNATTTMIAPRNTQRASLLIFNTGAQTVFLAFGEAATTAKFPLAAGRDITITNGLAVNGIVASGTGTVAVLEEGR